MENMCKPQSVQMDCRITSCIFNREGGVCIIEPKITLNENRQFICWSSFIAKFSGDEEKENIIKTIKRIP
jgi:hypothetical protein